MVFSLNRLQHVKSYDRVAQLDIRDHDSLCDRAPHRLMSFSRSTR